MDLGWQICNIRQNLIVLNWKVDFKCMYLMIKTHFDEKHTHNFISIDGATILQICFLAIKCAQFSIHLCRKIFGSSFNDLAMRISNSIPFWIIHFWLVATQFSMVYKLLLVNFFQIPLCNWLCCHRKPFSFERFSHLFDPFLWLNWVSLLRWSDCC